VPPRVSLRRAHLSGSLRYATCAPSALRRPPYYPRIPHAFFALLAGPRSTLIGFSDGPDTLVDEALHARGGICFRRIQIPFGIGIQIVNAEELPRLSTTVAERRQDFKRAAQYDADLFVDAI